MVTWAAVRSRMLLCDDAYRGSSAYPKLHVSDELYWSNEGSNLEAFNLYLK